MEIILSYAFHKSQSDILEALVVKIVIVYPIEEILGKF